MQDFFDPLLSALQESFKRNKKYVKTWKLYTYLFNALSPLKGHTYLNKLAVCGAGLFEYIWPFSGHQALMGYIHAFLFSPLLLIFHDHKSMWIVN